MKSKKIVFLVGLLVCIVVLITFFLGKDRSSPEKRSMAETPKNSSHESHTDGHEHKKIETKEVMEEEVHSDSIQNQDSNLKAEGFETLLKETGEKLPTYENFHPTPEEAHHTPPQILQASAMIGEILEEVEKNPELKEKAMSFFKGCLDNGQNIPVMRALCLDSLLIVKDEQLDSETVDQYTKDPEVKRLVLQLQGL